jgi:hypothetical protein
VAPRVRGGGDALCHDDVDRYVHQFCRQLQPTRKITLGEAKFEDEVAAFDVAEIAEPRSEPV